MARKILFALIIAIFLLQTPAAASNVSVYVDGEPLWGAYIANNTTMVPLRRFCKSISSDCAVSWSSKTRTAYVSADGLSITARCGEEYIVANERYIYVGKNSFISDSGVFMLPVRALAKAFGASVHWNNSSRSTTVTSGNGIIESGAEFYDADAVYWLARIISAEAQGESLRGQIAVGNVVMNRVASPDYPNTIYKVIFDRRGGVQFTPVANGTIYDKPADVSIIAAKLVLDGADVAGDCMYFLNEEISTSFWITENCSYVMTIGNHSFYV
ncbi:MAG: cell wall hydrolase [Oscillospiraceae bacterium]|nr:cell wall hydrolase [Oscillospiraceae bacterium]